GVLVAGLVVQAPCALQVPPVQVRFCTAAAPCRCKTAPGENMIAITPLDPGSVFAASCRILPALSRMVMVPRVSLLRQPAAPTVVQPVRVLYLKLLETAYHSRSPSPSRRSGRPRFLHGSRPMRVVCPVVPA